MHPTLRISILIAVLLLPAYAAFAGGDLDFACVAKKVDQKTTQSGTTENAITIDTEDWKYVVTLSNNGFKDMTNLEVRYIIFYKLEEMGTVAGVRVGKQTGVAKIDNLKGHDKVDFDTQPVKLQKASAKPGNYFNNGGRTQGTASLSGLWIRVYQNGNLIAEMSRPSELSSKEKWIE